MMDDKGAVEKGIVWNDFCGNNCDGPCKPNCSCAKDIMAGT
jgi:hypothetical protein